jgi:hypothetical protein
MTDHNETIPASRLGERTEAGVIGPEQIRRSAKETVVGDGVDQACASVLEVNAPECESLLSVVSDVDGFARGWIGRIRGLIHRSSQLVERESRLADAITRLDEQKAEAAKRHASREQELEDQAKRLTEVWLEVEEERRKAIQGGRPVTTAVTKPIGGPVVAQPVQPVAPLPHQPTGTSGSVQSANGQSQMPAAPPLVDVNAPVSGPEPPAPNASTSPPAPAVGPPMPLTNAPISASQFPSPPPDRAVADAVEQAEAATRQKLEEFKRMQRDIRTNRRT